MPDRRATALTARPAWLRCSRCSWIFRVHDPFIAGVCLERHHARRHRQPTEVDAEEHPDA